MSKEPKFWKKLIWIILMGYILVVFVVQRADVYGDSMEPALSSGDVLLVDKLTPRITGYERFDVVVFRYRYREDSYYIKRIVGLPGETVQIVDGRVWIDGEILEDDVGAELIKKAKRASDPILLGEGEYFVLGDNRNHSSDSRDSDIGNLTEDDILGRAWLRIWPFARFGMIR